VAEEALEEISAYTLREWGEEQCERYMSLLEETCERLIPRHAALARQVPSRPDLRMLRCEQHMIYFRAVDDGFEIVHVLHGRQLPARHL
jgi:toxin ParE1/3/4